MLGQCPPHFSALAASIARGSPSLSYIHMCCRGLCVRYVENGMNWKISNFCLPTTQKLHLKKLNWVSSRPSWLTWQDCVGVGNSTQCPGSPTPPPPHTQQKIKTGLGLSFCSGYLPNIPKTLTSRLRIRNKREESKKGGKEEIKEWRRDWILTETSCCNSQKDLAQIVCF